MRILTLNLWKNEGDFPARLAPLRVGLADLSPDIVCFQEVYQDAFINALNCGVSPQLPHHVFAPAREKLRDGNMSCSGLAILSRNEIVDSAILELPSSPADGGRVALRASIVTALGAVRVVNVHLSHLRGQHGSALRATQWEAVWRWAHTDWTHPIIICGDFNALISEPWLALYLEQHRGQASAAYLCGETSLMGRPDALIDHLVLAGRGKLDMTSATLKFTTLPMISDHFGVLGYFQAL